MKPSTSPSQPPSEAGLAAELGRLRAALRQHDPRRLAANVGAQYTESAGSQAELTLPFFGAPQSVRFPELVACRATGEALPIPPQALLLYHLLTSDGSAPTGQWVSYADLPNGRVYAQAFQGYTGGPLTRVFGNALEPFRAACLAASGQPAPMADAAFDFLAFPRLPLRVVYWLGEDEIPPSARVLFDATATHHLPVDVCAILGSMLVSRIMKRKPG